MPSLKASIKLALIDCNAPKEKTGVYTEIPMGFYRKKVEEFSAKER
ncbi:MAG: hypothetical protein QW275_03410 [Candidatus Anstonellaceae archaeon]